MNRQSPYASVAVWGAGKSGWAVAQLFAECGARVTLYDDRDAADFARADVDDVHLKGGGLTFQDEELVVLSPGIPPHSEAIQTLLDSKKAFMSEVEAALLFTDTPVIAVTGTDGKSTTSAMLDHVLQSSGYESVVCGNFGIPVCEIIRQRRQLDYLVIEISAFQLWSTHSFEPKVAVLTNIAEDHLSYFEHSFEAYQNAKLRIFRDMKAGAVVMRSDLAIQFSDLVDPNVEVLTFDVHDSAVDWYLDGEHLTNRKRFLMNRSLLRVAGRHNVANALTTAAALSTLGLSAKDIAKGLASFVGLAHRMEFVRVLDEVSYYNDSKATNPHAAMSGLGAMDGPLIVIAGGFDKGLDLQEFATVLSRSRYVLLTGPAGESLAGLLDSSCRFEVVGSLEDAVRRAARVSQRGDTVVLAPGSSSFDAFKSFEHRGDVFKRAVHAL